MAGFQYLTARIGGRLEIRAGGVRVAGVVKVVLIRYVDNALVVSLLLRCRIASVPFTETL